MNISESKVHSSVKDTLPLNIKGICNNIRSNSIILTYIAYENPLTSKTFDWECKSSYGTQSRISYSNQGCTIFATNEARLSTPILTDSTNWKMTFEMKPSQTMRVGVGVGFQDYGPNLIWRSDTGNTWGFNNNVFTTNWNTVEIIRVNNEYYCIVNGTQSSVVTMSVCPENRLRIWKWGGGNIILRNLKVELI